MEEMLLTISKDGNTQPRGRNRNESLEVSSAKRWSRELLAAGRIHNRAFYVLGDEGSQNTAGDSATTLSEGEQENTSKDDPRVG